MIRTKIQDAARKHMLLDDGTPNNALLMLEVNNAILEERTRQNEKWGKQRHPHEVWHVIASEETGEVAQAILSAKGWGKETDAQNLYKECVQAAAVYQAFAEQVLEEMRKKEGTP